MEALDFGYKAVVLQLHIPKQLSVCEWLEIRIFSFITISAVTLQQMAEERDMF